MDVCIIGGGWSGLYAAKYALENGLKPVVLERRDDLGGVWNYTDDNHTTTVMKSTISSSSRVVTEASDFFMDESVGHFMHHDEIMTYLRAYVKEFDLAPYLEFGAEVVAMNKTGDQWEVKYRQQGSIKTLRVKNVAVCAGLHNKQRNTGPLFERFSGNVTHSGNIKEISPTDYSEKDHVLVYGGGETASDIIDLLVETPARVTWAIRGGQHFLRKTLFHQRNGVGQFSKHDFALDTLASPLINGVSPLSKNALGRRYIADLVSTGSVTQYQGHGEPLWKNDLKYAQQFFNKNGHTVEHVISGRVTPQNEVVDVSDREIHFKSGDCDSFSHVICCFGYEFHCPFLPPELRNAPLSEHFQFVFPAADPSVAFLGFARPIIGSIPLITEMQCLWAFRVFAGQVTLPTEKEMNKRQAENNRKWDRKLPGRGELKTLVLPSTYVAMMLKEAYPGRSPGEHFWKKPLRALKFMSWIPSASIRFALDPKISDTQFNELWKKRSHGLLIGFVLPIFILISRLFYIEKMVDWYVNRQDRKNRPAGPQTRHRKLPPPDVHKRAA